MEDLDSNSYNDLTTSGSVGGMAIKNGKTTWTVVLKDKQQFTVTNEDLMDPSQFFVRHKCVSDDLNSIEKRSSQQNRKEHVCQKSSKESKQSVRRQGRSCTNLKERNLTTYLQ